MIDSDENNLHKAFTGLSRLVLEFNINFDDFCKTLREYYIRETHKACKTVARTSLRASIDRRIVSAILKDEKQYIRPSAIMLILKKIEKLASKNNGIVKKTGHNSLDNIIRDIAYGATTLNTVVDELSALGCIEDRGTNVRFIRSQIDSIENKNKYLQNFSTHVERYIDSILLESCATGGNYDEFETNIVSSRIPQERFSEIHRLTDDILFTASQQLLTLYKSHETKTPASRNNKEIGITITKF
jgi:hypothetical protein